MPDFTTRRNISIPASDRSDSADVPLFIRNVGFATDVDVLYVQDTLANIPLTHVAGRFFFATDTKQLFYDDGTAYHQIKRYLGRVNATQFRALAGMVDGDECDISINASNGDLWRVEYVSAIGDAYKWVVKGANDYYNFDSRQAWRTAGGFGDLSDGGGSEGTSPQIAVPLDGAYDVRSAFKAYHQGDGSGAWHSTEANIAINGVIVGFNSLPFYSPPKAVGVNIYGAAVSDPLQTNLVRGTNIQLKYQQSSGFSSGLLFYDRKLAIIPRRLAQT